METVVLGETIEFSIYYYDGDGEPFDPPTVQLDIVRSSTTLVYGPFVTEVDNYQPGSYRYTLSIPTTITPGIYAAKWSTTDYNNDPKIDYQSFQILDIPVTASTQLDKPRTYGVIRDSFIYANMGVGATDRVFLIGHADGLSLNDPLQVADMQEAINILGADQRSPLLRALLEVFNTGGRDIWLVASAPMNEYVENYWMTDSYQKMNGVDLNFYERYYQRLETTYAVFYVTMIIQTYCAFRGSIL
jgi:hypothetical protein